MKRLFLALLIPLALAIARQAQAQNYAPNWESIDKRPTPQWFDDAKFGIFIHWGVYSVPAFADPHSAVGAVLRGVVLESHAGQERAHVGVSLAPLRRQLQVPGFCRPV